MTFFTYMEESWSGHFREMKEQIQEIRKTVQEMTEESKKRLEQARKDREEWNKKMESLEKDSPDAIGPSLRQDVPSGDNKHTSPAS